jgi:hypothetical protein
MQSSCCLCVCESPFINFRMPVPIFMKLGMYIIAPVSITTMYFINPLVISLRVCICTPPIVARQLLGKHVLAEEKARNNRTAGRVCLSIPLSLLGNNSV